MPTNVPKQIARDCAVAIETAIENQLAFIISPSNVLRFASGFRIFPFSVSIPSLSSKDHPEDYMKANLVSLSKLIWEIVCKETLIPEPLTFESLVQAARMKLSDFTFEAILRGLR